MREGVGADSLSLGLQKLAQRLEPQPGTRVTVGRDLLHRTALRGSRWLENIFTPLPGTCDPPPHTGLRRPSPRHRSTTHLIRRFVGGLNAQRADGHPCTANAPTHGRAFPTHTVSYGARTVACGLPPWLPQASPLTAWAERAM